METLVDLKQAAEIKEKENRIMSQAYAKTLFALIPANFVLVVGAALLSLVAGATILVKGQILTELTSGVLALVSGAFTIIHSKLGCEQYQAECKKLVSFYRGIAEDYGNLQFTGDIEEFRKRFLALNEQRSAVTKSTSALPLSWFIPKASKK